MRSPISGPRHGGFINRLIAFWHDADPALRRRLVGIYALLIAFNLVAWGALLLAAAQYPLLLGLGQIAFGFGLRHAVDPDHIAAIDNTTRKLMQEGKRPVGVGFFFSLGHSSIVFCLSVFIALSAAFVKTSLPQMQNVGRIIGTSVSGGFLLVIAAINLAVFMEIYRTWRQVLKGTTCTDQTLDEFLSRRGLLTRLLRPMLRMVTKSWHMYLVGLLFGLGFDTASEVGLLGMTATAGAGGMPVWFILLLPLLFVAGMSLADTTDGVAMLGAYGWATVRPVRKLYYNMNITLISVIIALFIGGIEVLQVISNETGTTAGPLGWAGSIDFGNLGYYIVGIFLASWIVSVLLYRVRGIARLDDALTRTVTAGSTGRSE